MFDNECWSLWWSHLLLKTFLIHSLMGYSNSISLFAWYLLLTADCNISIWLMIAYYAAGSTSSPVPWLAHSGRSSSKFGAKYYSGLRGFIMVQWIGPYGSGLFPKTVWPAKTFWVKLLFVILLLQWMTSLRPSSHWVVTSWSVCVPQVQGTCGQEPPAERNDWSPYSQRWPSFSMLCKTFLR